MDEEEKPKDIDISIIDIYILLVQNNKSMKPICTRTSLSFLQVINKPIIFYQLEFLERQGIKKVKLLIDKDDIASKPILDSFKGKIEFDIIPINTDKLDLFEVIRKRLDHNNFILIEGDSILSFDLWKFIENHLNNNNILSLVLQKQDSEIKHLKKWREKTSHLYGIDFEHNNRIVFFKKINLDDTRNITIKKKILKRCPKIDFFTKYFDIGFYIFNDSIFDVLEIQKVKEKELELNIESIKDEFIPLLIDNTFLKDFNVNLIEKHNNQLLQANRIKICAKLIDNNENINSEYIYKIYDYPSYISTIDEIQKPFDRIKKIFLQTKNNTKNYFTNFEQKILENLDNNKKYSDGIPELELISQDCYLADKINSIGKGTKIEKTVCSQNLKVDENSKIIGCLIGLDSEIGKNCTLKNCIIGDNVIIADNSKISDCILGDNYNFKNESKKEASDEIFY